MCNLDALGNACRTAGVVEDDGGIHLRFRCELLPAVTRAFRRRGQEVRPVLNTLRGLPFAIESVVAAVEAEDLACGKADALCRFERSVQATLGCDQELSPSIL